MRRCLLAAPAAELYHRGMEIIRGAIPFAEEGLSKVQVFVDRATLSKRRWRGEAGDGNEFGFDLESPLADGATFFQKEDTVYVIAQKPEALLEVRAGEGAESARLGWMIGNLHFPIELGNGVVFTVDDQATRGLFQRERISFNAVSRVFRPLSAVAHVHH